jgi:hypothetical protein
MIKATAHHTVFVSCSPEEVWDYTQNWERRTEWDRSVLSAEYLSHANPISVQVRGSGGVTFQVQYKVSERPRLTTLVMSDVRSPWIRGGGGSWKYEAEMGGTRWTQNNTIVLRGEMTPVSSSARQFGVELDLHFVLA